MVFSYCEKWVMVRWKHNIGGQEKGNTMSSLEDWKVAELGLLIENIYAWLIFTLRAKSNIFKADSQYVCLVFRKCCFTFPTPGHQTKIPGLLIDCLLLREYTFLYGPNVLMLLIGLFLAIPWGDAKGNNISVTDWFLESYQPRCFSILSIVLY